MVAHLVRLKLTLLRNGLRRSPWQVVGLVLGGLYGLSVAGGLGIGLVALAAHGDPVLSREVLVCAGAVLVAGWILLPLVAFGVDETLDPERFVMFPVPRAQLLIGLGTAALIGVPGVVTTLLVLGSGLVWWRSVGAAAVAVVGAVLALALCVLGSRAVTTALAPLLAGRRGREVVGFVAIGALALAYLTFGRLSSGLVLEEATLRAALSQAADVLAWTPLGAAWAAPADAAAGDWGSALARLGLVAATVAAFAALWAWALGRALVRARGSGGSGATARGPGWFGRLPASPTGAVAARCVTYWLRDPRYLLAVGVAPVLPLALWAFGAGEMVLAAVPLSTLMLGWSVASDTSTDGTALWLHVAAPLRGVHDRAGRVLGAVLVLGPVTVVLAVVLAVTTGRAADLPAVLAAAIGTFLTALGCGSVLSAVVVARVQQAGESPFATRPNQSLTAVLSQMAGMLVAGTLALPGNVLALLAILWDSVVLGWVALLVGPVLGTLLLVVGVRWGGHLLDRRAPVLLQQLVSMN